MSLEFWRNVSIIWLGIQMLVLCLLPAAIAFFAVRGMAWTLKKVPAGLDKAQSISAQVRGKTAAVAQKAADPVIAARARASGIQATIAGLGDEKPPAGGL